MRQRRLLRPAICLVTAATLTVGVSVALAAQPSASRAKPTAAAAAPHVAPLANTGIQIENSFVSSVGWVKPGDTYVFRVLVRNYGTSADVAAKVTAVQGMSFTGAHQVGGGTVTPTANLVTWDIGIVAAGTSTQPTIKTLIVDAKADSLVQDPQVVWRNLSTIAEFTAGATGESESHGPRVIPPGENFETARYGDRPFPVVPVDYIDFKHSAAHSAGKLDEVINSPTNKASTFSLYQEMSLGQLFPKADIPSEGIPDDNYSPADGQTFTTSSATKLNTCHGVTSAQLNGGKPLFGQKRVKGGWYQLPGMRDYYGDDSNGSALIGAEAGVGQLQALDEACGPAAKLAYDAAVAADPDIDYSDFDTDKDGVVDFFEVIFQGKDGAGASQTNVPPYDNIWPHSSTLEGTYVDAATGLPGYTSKDQLKNLEGEPLWYTNVTRTQMTTTPGPANLKVFVRVGPYNVNPETAIDKASVISHEYGHSLGAPDYYSTGSRATYGDYMLMATDKSQNSAAFQLQDYGWVVPEPVPYGTKVTDWTDTKKDTHTIRWQTPDGTPYTLSGPGVHNALVYNAKLPGKRIIDPKKVQQGASPSHVWWSQAGNDFGCSPLGGHNFDIALPQLKNIPAGTPVTMTLKHAWEIEWDFDYGYVLIGVPNSAGAINEYTSAPSKNGNTTPASTNPNSNPCQAKYGNGLTGSSTSWKNGTEEIDRRGIGDLTGLSQFDSYPDFTFVEDSFDLSALAGKNGAVRFSYSTDVGLAYAGWFIDNVTIKAGNQTIFSSDFEKTGGPRDAAIFNGGCQGTKTVASKCTHGWQYLNTSVAAPFDVGYYLSMRDRSGFDQDGHGQNERAPIGFNAGLLLEYTDETHGYGNVGVNDPPAQSPLDARPSPGDETPELNDATFHPGDTFDDHKGHTDNYTDPASKTGNWEFKYNCLKFTVNKMTGQTPGPEFPAIGAGSDLTGDVTFADGKGCGAFDYGFGVPNTAPRARAAAKPATVMVNQPVTFNGSQSSDDTSAPSQLKYRWDFNGDGKTDATGETVRHAYSQAGKYTVRLTVTDVDGASGSDTVVVTVLSSLDRNSAGGPIATTGLADWLPPLAMLFVIGGLAAARLRRRTT
ncbi:MAG: hypothetical protein QOG53_3027 [Frankiales bacterium]|jgi:M6 family metalloprotease-like protein|nr:hypothetical protein [Frankiales bacterium]